MNINSKFFKKPQQQGKTRLFCFSYAGGGPSFFAPFATSLSMEVLPIILPGRDERLLDEPYYTIKTLVSDLIDEFQYYLDAPFVFWGHCVGALIAFELAVSIRNLFGFSPNLFIASASPSPHDTYSDILYHTKSNSEFVKSLRELNKSSDDYLPNDEMLTILLPGLRADFALYETYNYTKNHMLDCPIFAMGSKEDTRVSESRVQLWKNYTLNSFVYQSFTGNHFFINKFTEEISTLINNFFG